MSRGNVRCAGCGEPKAAMQYQGDGEMLCFDCLQDISREYTESGQELPHQLFVGSQIVKNCRECGRAFPSDKEDKRLRCDSCEDRLRLDAKKKMCIKCGDDYVFTNTIKSPYCPSCRTELDEGICIKCGTLYYPEDSETGKCSACKGEPKWDRKRLCPRCGKKKILPAQYMCEECLEKT